MDILKKYALPARRHQQLLNVGSDPFGVVMDEVYSATEARINGRLTVLAGTNNYLGLTFDKDAITAALRAIESLGTGTTGSRIANGTHQSHAELEAAMSDPKYTMMQVPVELVPAVRKLIAKRVG